MERRTKKKAQIEERCMPMENGLSYAPGIAPAHSNVMSLAVSNKMACGGWEMFEFTTFP